mmetsp:Transcript_62422/g.151954  ORF Transcript_62422/g.151954 Transcript_62422/m.151954 type:complete len:85 (-) Transcript_62422:1118-1372(-)|eukprot:CAMPEP_0113454132 /NCGR_PEP_ID=MMETSP0014_2-20120614/7708_1 /TAXON_ID=2857 /ORGANISM="Nitzschia sp." /LENGTH=84 /DNA_ID=CAMNT_0000345533 /DNA_START=54 /DNA_END=308 /DNA_ORIENTATION=- /assembly_acc=CAM_ASM_000159
MNKPTITFLLLAVLVSAVAAFFKPAVPHQVAAPNAAAQTIFAAVVPRGGAGATTSLFDDAGLDNDAVEADTNISPSRKCGFCMG